MTDNISDPELYSDTEPDILYYFRGSYLYKRNVLTGAEEEVCAATTENVLNYLKAVSYTHLVDRTVRKTSATVGKDAKLIIRERILTDGEQQAITDFEVEMNGENSSVNLISRSVAKGKSHQAYRSKIVGNAPCAGHSECDAIIADEGKVDAAPELSANHEDAALIHEAAIGKIAGDQIIKLRTLGLTEEEAEARIVAGFLK